MGRSVSQLLRQLFFVRPAAGAGLNPELKIPCHWSTSTVVGCQVTADGVMADECVAKKLRTNPDGACSEEAPASASNETSSGCESLSGFQIKRILMENCESKLIVVEGSFERNSSQNTVVVLEKSHFLESEVRSMLATGSKIETQFRNDIYASLTCYPPSELNGIKVTLIHPATEKHVDKYTTKQRHLVEESREAYEEITLPHINGSCFSIDVNRTQVYCSCVCADFPSFFFHYSGFSTSWMVGRKQIVLYLMTQIWKQALFYCLT